MTKVAMCYKQSENQLLEKYKRIVGDYYSPFKIKLLLEDIDELIETIKGLVDEKGTSEHKVLLKEVLKEYKTVEKSKDFTSAQTFLSKLNLLRYDILKTIPEYWAGVFIDIKENFDTIKWKNRADAESLVDRGSDVIAGGSYDVQDIVHSLWALMEDADIESSKGRTDLLGIVN